MRDLGEQPEGREYEGYKKLGAFVQQNRAEREVTRLARPQHHRPAWAHRRLVRKRRSYGEVQ
jgi:hypothetical protein